MSASSIANCKYPWVRSNEVNQTAALTACSASSICGKGKESHTVMALRAREIYVQLYFPCLLTDYNYLRCIWTPRRPDYTLPEPGIQTLPDFSLKLNWYCAMRQVNWFIRCGQDRVFEADHKDLSPCHTMKIQTGCHKFNSKNLTCCSLDISTFPRLSGKGSLSNSFWKLNSGLLNLGQESNFGFSPGSLIGFTVSWLVSIVTLALAV